MTRRQRHGAGLIGIAAGGGAAHGRPGRSGAVGRRAVLWPLPDGAAHGRPGRSNPAPTLPSTCAQGCAAVPTCGPSAPLDGPMGAADQPGGLFRLPAVHAAPRGGIDMLESKRRQPAAAAALASRPDMGFLGAARSRGKAADCDSGPGASRLWTPLEAMRPCTCAESPALQAGGAPSRAWAARREKSRGRTTALLCGSPGAAAACMPAAHRPGSTKSAPEPRVDRAVRRACRRSRGGSGGVRRRRSAEGEGKNQTRLPTAHGRPPAQFI